MGYYIVVRGPAGCGKTSIAKGLAERLEGCYISIDKLLKELKLDKVEGECISQGNFLEANKAAVKEAKRNLERGIPVVFDGCFYHRSQLEDLKANLPYRHSVFTLNASLEECIKRDKERPEASRIGDESIKAVFSLVSSYRAGKYIETSGKTEKEVLEDIISLLPDGICPQ